MLRYETLHNFASVLIDVTVIIFRCDIAISSYSSSSIWSKGREAILLQRGIL